MTVPTTGRYYADEQRTPVPYPAYKCKSAAQEPRVHAPHFTLTHQCKLGVDHPGEHRCICGKHWKICRKN